MGEVIRHGPTGIRIHCGWLSRSDQQVILDVMRRDCYRVTRRNYSPQLILDIGAHIGCFALMCRQRWPEAEIICVEPCPENIPVLKANVERFAEVRQAACYYGDEKLHFYNAATIDGHAAETSGGLISPVGVPTVHATDTRPLESVTLEQLVPANQHNVLLKLDCEQAEHNILPAMKIRPGLVIGEYHGRDRWLKTLASLVDYRVEWDRKKDQGLFTAKKT